MAEAVDATIEALVAHALEQRAEVIEQLVYAELERRVGVIVDARLNGSAPLDSRAARPDTPPRSEAPTTKTCKVCAETKPASAFDRHRHTCKRCRRSQERERAARRQATGDEELPRTAPQPVDEATSDV